MKAIFLTRYGDSQKAFEFRDIPIPECEPGQVVVKVNTFGLNFADVLARRGLYPDAPKNPAVLGYDVSGTVHDIGEGVSGLEIGQRVTALTRFGGYAEYASTMAEGVSPIPDSMDYATATALATQGCTAYYCAEECVTMHPGDRILVQAAGGGVGSLLVQLSKHRGCHVYGTASSSKQDYLRQLGVDKPIDYTRDDFEKVIDQDNTDGIDIVFDSIGGRVFRKGMKLLAPGGRMVSFGAASQMSGKGNKIKALGVALNFGLFSPIPLLMQSKSLITVNMLRIADHRKKVFNHVLKSVVDLTAQSILKPHVGKIFHADEISDAHDFLESRKSIGKVAVSWT